MPLTKDFAKRSANAPSRSRDSARRCFAKQSNSCSPAMRRRPRHPAQLYQRHSRFRQLEEATSIPANSLMRNVWAEWQPSAKNLFGVPLIFRRRKA